MYSVGSPQCRQGLKLLTVEPVYNGHSQKDQKWFSMRIMLNAGQMYCRMLHAILSIFIKLQFVIKRFVLSICEWPLTTGLTVYGTMYGPN